MGDALLELREEFQQRRTVYVHEFSNVQPTRHPQTHMSVKCLELIDVYRTMLTKKVGVPRPYVVEKVYTVNRGIAT